MSRQSIFSRLCAELSRSLVPQLETAGFTLPHEPFSRHTLKYEFTRRAPTGVQVIEILFNKYRKPVFSVQIYIAPPSGMPMLVEHGGSLVIGYVSSSPRGWPFPVRPFRAEPTRLQRLLGQRGDCVEQSVQLFLSLIPEVEDWWTHQRSTRHITVGTINYPGASRDAQP
jgi:hypothetical protein